VTVREGPAQAVASAVALPLKSTLGRGGAPWGALVEAPWFKRNAFLGIPGTLGRILPSQG